jgi:hypothetical protein
MRADDLILTSEEDLLRVKQRIEGKHEEIFDIFMFIGKRNFGV